MALNIKNQVVEQLAAEVARLAGESKTEAVRRALVERRMRLIHGARRRQRLEDAIALLEREVWSTIPKGLRGHAPMSREEEDDILGYGPHGV